MTSYIYDSLKSAEFYAPYVGKAVKGKEKRQQLIEDRKEVHTDISKAWNQAHYFNNGYISSQELPLGPLKPVMDEHLDSLTIYSKLEDAMEEKGVLETRQKTDWERLGKTQKDIETLTQDFPVQTLRLRNNLSKVEADNSNRVLPIKGRFRSYLDNATIEESKDNAYFYIVDFKNFEKAPEYNISIEDIKGLFKDKEQHTVGFEIKDGTIFDPKKQKSSSKLKTAGKAVGTVAILGGAGFLGGQVAMITTPILIPIVSKFSSSAASGLGDKIKDNITKPLGNGLLSAATAIGLKAKKTSFNAHRINANDIFSKAKVLENGQQLLFIRRKRGKIVKESGNLEVIVGQRKDIDRKFHPQFIASVEIERQFKAQVMKLIVLKALSGQIGSINFKVHANKIAPALYSLKKFSNGSQDGLGELETLYRQVIKALDNKLENKGRIESLKRT